MELSRIYFEIGTRLRDEQSPYRELNGIKGDGYLEKARSLFADLDLKWDLEKLDLMRIYT